MLHPIRAAVLNPDWGPRVVPPPYDALAPEQRDEHLDSHPDSFLHVARSAGLGQGHPTEHQRLAEEGDASLQRLLSAGAYSPREESRLYVQRIVAPEGVQWAVLGCLRNGEVTLRPHEEVHPGRVRALAAHFRLVGAMSSPVLITSRPGTADPGLIDRVKLQAPLRDLMTSDGTQVSLWGVDLPWVDLDGPLYVVDGHHRVAAAEQARFNQLFVAYVAPEDLQVASFDRVIDELALMPRRIAELLSPFGETRLFDAAGLPEPEPGLIVLKLGDQGVTVRRRSSGTLDSVFVHEVVLPEAFGIEGFSDPRLSYRPSQAGPAKEPVVISTAPVRLEQVLDVADAGGVMPPKSTCFLPKARSGVLLVPC